MKLLKIGTKAILVETKKGKQKYYITSKVAEYLKNTNLVGQEVVVVFGKKKGWLLKVSAKGASSGNGTGKYNRKFVGAYKDLETRIFGAVCQAVAGCSDLTIENVEATIFGLYEKAYVTITKKKNKDEENLDESPQDETSLDEEGLGGDGLEEEGLDEGEEDNFNINEE